MGKTKGTRSLSLWLSQLLPESNMSLGRKQIIETGHALPVLILFHFCAAIGISNLVNSEVPQVMLRGWQFSVVLAALPLLLSAYRLSLSHSHVATTNLVLKLSPLGGVMLGAVWAAPTSLFPGFVDPADVPVIYSIVLTMIAVGMVSLLRLPLAGILFSVIATAAINFSIFRHLSGYQQLVGYFSYGLFAVALVSAIIVFHKSFVRQWAAEEDLVRQGHVIKLLLNDFERGTGDILWEANSTGKIEYASGRVDSAEAGDNLPALTLPALLGMNERDSEFLNSEMAARKIIEAKAYDGKDLLDEKHWMISARPLYDEDENFTGYRGVARDVTWQWQQDQLVLLAKQEAERANTAKSQFLAVISHELRTPISAIVGFAEILGAPQAENLPIEKRRDFLGTILESAKHLQGLINDVLDATRMERGAMKIEEQENDVAELVETTLKICRDHATAAKISLVGHVVDGVQVTGDLTRLKQVILNLLTNAIKFSPAGGVVYIETARRSDGALVISVRDAGIGISPEDSERVFEPFVQAEGGSNRRFGGMGLGLAISRKIARLHGGDVTLEGQPGIGSEARLILPRSRVAWPNASGVKTGGVAA